MGSLGERIAEARERSGLSQEQVAVHLGLTPQAISSYERGKSVPEAERIAQLATILGVSTDDLDTKQGRPQTCPHCGVDGTPYLRGIWEGWRRCLKSLYDGSHIGNTLYTLVAKAMSNTGLSADIRMRVYRAVQEIHIPDVFYEYERRSRETRMNPVIRFCESKKGESNPQSKLNWERVGEIRREAKEGKLSWGKLAKKHGVSSTMISMIVRNEKWYDHNYTPLKYSKQPCSSVPKSMTWEKVRALRAEYATDPKPLSVLGEKYGVSARHARAVILGTSWKDQDYNGPSRIIRRERKKKVHSGESHSNSVLNWDMVEEARERNRKGESIASISKSMGVNQSTMRMAVRGETWANPPSSSSEKQPAGDP